jgi:xylose isomerase
MRIKNSVGIWAFQEMPTRFLGAGYHPEYKGVDMVARTEAVVKGCGALVDGYEYHYPGEINEQNVNAIVKALGKDHSVYCVASGAHTYSKHARGAFTNPDPGVRAEAIAMTKAGIDLAASLKAHFIIWPGIEGYNYPFQSDYRAAWKWFLDGIRACVEHARKQGVLVLLEHKNSEPAMKIHMRDVGMTMFVIHRLQAMGVDVSNLKVNLDWQHLIMNGEHIPEYATLLSDLDLLGHHHANSGWGMFDDDNMVGSTYFMTTLEIAKTLQQLGYGQNGERVGFDLFPYTEDPVQAVNQSVLQWEFIWDLATKIDDAALAEARGHKDAVGAYRAVFAALGMDQKFIDQVYRGRSAP